MFVSYIIILLLIIYFAYLMIKYSGMEKPEYNLQYYRDKEYIKYPTIVVGYLDNKSIKAEHFIATVLDFVCKGFVKVEQSQNKTDYIFTIIKSIKATNFEKEALRIFFNKSFLEIGTKQSLNQFKKIIKNEKIFGNWGEIKRYFNSEIREYFDKKQDVKKITRSTNIKNILLCYFLFLIICYSSIVEFEGVASTNRNIIPLIFLSTIAFSLFIVAITIIKSSLLGGFSWSTAIISTSFFLNTLFFIYFDLTLWVFLVLVIMAIIILFDDMIQRKKTTIANAHEMIKGLKKYIKDYSNIDEYDIYNIYLWDEYYVYAVALNIKCI